MSYLRPFHDKTLTTIFILFSTLFLIIITILSSVIINNNLKSCSLFIQIKCYLGTVIPIIEYACTVWAPYTAQNINKIEMIERRAAWFIHSISISNMLK